jgi:exonuclease VII small subunit
MVNVKKVKIKKSDEILEAVKKEASAKELTRAYELMRTLVQKLDAAKKVVENYEIDLDRLKKSIDSGTFSKTTHL